MTDPLSGQVRDAVTASRREHLLAEARRLDAEAERALRAAETSGTRRGKAWHRANAVVLRRRAAACRRDAEPVQQAASP